MPAAVAEGIRTIRPACHVEHLNAWQGGEYHQEADEIILNALHSTDLALVTCDVRTIPAVLLRWLAEGRSIPPVALIPFRQIASNDVGAITRSLVVLYDEPSPFDSAYPVVYLQPAPR